MAEIEKASLSGAELTALIELYGKALDSRRPDSMLSDRDADQALQRLGYDFGALRLRRRDQKSAAVRAKAYDRCVQHFLGAHRECVVLHLGCGLENRVYRVNPPSTVDWYDIDLPDVIGLRRRLLPPRAGLHSIAASVTDRRLLDTIPGDKPVLVIAEGLTPYLRAADDGHVLGAAAARMFANRDQRDRRRPGDARRRHPRRDLGIDRHDSPSRTGALAQPVLAPSSAPLCLEFVT
ncbi:MAG TPA: class I SAM-dependent methyltransferase [Mycobacterium sp.]|nr:class I SAM-dependent methyltransferase [Mycobacterium sp.]